MNIKHAVKSILCILTIAVFFAAIVHFNFQSTNNYIITIIGIFIGIPAQKKKY